MNAKVTIGLCVKNGAKVVKTAFDSISIQDYPHEFLKLVIIDEGSSDYTAEKLGITCALKNLYGCTLRDYFKSKMYQWSNLIGSKLKYMGSV